MRVEGSGGFFGEAFFNEGPVEFAVVGPAEGLGDDEGGVAAGVGDAGAHGHEHGVGTGDFVRADFESLAANGGRDGVASGFGAFPVAAEGFDLAALGIEIDIAGEGDDGVVSGIAVGEVVAHLRRGEVGDGVFGAEDAVAHGVGAEVFFAGALVEDPEGFVLVHGDFFEDYAALGGEVLLAEGGAHHVGEDVGGFGEELRKDGGVEGGEFGGGVGIGASAEFVELAVDVVAGAAVGTFEHHVFEEVGDAHDGGCFVTGAGADEEADGGGVGLWVGLGDDGEAVGERALLEGDGHSDLE